MSWLVSRHQAFEFFSPVEDDVDLVLLSPLFFYCLDHQKPLAVRGDVVALTPGVRLSVHEAGFSFAVFREGLADPLELIVVKVILMSYRLHTPLACQ